MTAQITNINPKVERVVDIAPPCVPCDAGLVPTYALGARIFCLNAPILHKQVLAVTK